MFHQSGGCCDTTHVFPGTSHRGADVHLGDLDIGSSERVPVWMGRNQFGYWQHTHLTIDVVPGRGGGFSLESPLGVRFLTRSRLFTDEESEVLMEQPCLTSKQGEHS